MLTAPFHKQTLSLALGAVLLVIMWLPHSPTITTSFAAVYREVFHFIQFASAIDLASDQSIATQLAIEIGRLTQSPLLGLHLSWLIGVTAFWGLTLLATWALSPRAALFSNIFLVMISCGLQTLTGDRPWNNALSHYFQANHFFHQSFIFCIVLLLLLADYWNRLKFTKLAILLVALFKLYDADRIYLAQLAAIALVSAGIFTAKQFRGYGLEPSVRTLLYIGTLSATTAVFFLFRSNVAVKDIAIHLFVLWISIAVALICDRVCSRWIVPPPRHSVAGTLMTLVTPIVALYFLVSTAMPGRSAFDTRVAARVDEALIALQQRPEAQSRQKANWVIAPIESLPNSVPSLLNFAIATNAFSQESPHSLNLEQLADRKAFHWLITDHKKNTPFFFSTCVQGKAGPLIAYKSDCINQVREEQISCSGSFALAKGGDATPGLFLGLSEAEDHGRWTDGNEVLLGCVVRGAPPRRLSMNVRGFTYGPLTTQRMRVTVNDGPVHALQISKQEEITLALPVLNDNDIMIIKFYFPDAISPRNLGLSPDARHLAVTIQSIAFKTD